MSFRNIDLIIYFSQLLNLGQKLQNFGCQKKGYKNSLTVNVLGGNIRL